jgi:RNA polymerase sigma factor (sigma-70 family)
MSVRVRLPNPLAALDDRALVTRFADGSDQPAFEQLVKRHRGLVFGVCKRAVRDTHLAEDAFQAVFLVLARNPRGALAAASVGGWLFGVARRVGLAARRHELRREKREHADALRHQGTDTPNTPQTDFDELLRVLDEELAAMPDEPRAALVACFLEERTHDEAARELGWSLSTLRRRLDRGKELLRARLARRGVALAVGLLTGAVAAPARAAVPALAPPGAAPARSVALAAEADRGGIGAKMIAVLAAIALATGGLAFGLTRDPADPTDPPNPPHAPAPGAAPAPRPVETKRWVTVSGRIVYPKDRELPMPRPVPAQLIKDADVWKQFGPIVYEDTLVHPENRGLAHVVVFLRPDSDDRKAEFPADMIHPELAKAKPADRTVLAARGQFEPRVLAVRAGDRVVFDNRLPVPTNVRYDSAVVPDDSDRAFNVLIVKDMGHATKPLSATRHPDHFTSSIYPWMAGYVWAFDHPYFAVTDADGRFELPHVPAGTWRLVAWHETPGYRGGAAGRLGAKLTVPESRTDTLELAPLNFTSDNWPE